MAAALTIGLNLRPGGTAATIRRAGKRPALRVWHAPETTFTPQIKNQEKPETREPKPADKIKFRKFTRTSWINKYGTRSASE